MTLRAVCFDWGGTLARHVEVELIDLWRAAATVLDPDDDGRLTEVLVDVERRSWGRTQTTMRSARLMDLLREASEELGLDVAEAVLSTAHDAHLDAWTPTIRHVPEARAVLEDLHDRGLAVGLLSNTHWPRSFHEHFLERDGLADLIDQRIYTCELDWIKPHPEPFRLLAQRLGVDPGECAYVGDRPIDDIQGAQGVGMLAVWVANDHAPGDGRAADAIIEDLAELPAVLDGWGVSGAL
ncbi:HAD family hydrolase [Euzebya sp.]|uniref:HAD family hydrolase n=1 Tax=Euzebya sp. TaxID=1971409 RepID=UPI0035124CFF